MNREKMCLAFILLAGVILTYADNYWMRAITQAEIDKDIKNQRPVNTEPRRVFLRVAGPNDVSIAGTQYQSGFTGDIMVPATGSVQIIHPKGQFTIQLKPETATFEIVAGYEDIATEEKTINSVVISHTALDFRRRPMVGPEKISIIQTPELTQMK